MTRDAPDPRVSDPLDFDPPIGVAEAVAPGVRRIVAPNPSLMTFRGTNTYVVGQGRVAIIDPGPDDGAHAAALTGALAGETVSHILVTHAHLDHSPLATRLGREWGVPVSGFGDAKAGRSVLMQRLAEAGLSGGGEGVDHAFVPDLLLKDGARIDGGGWSLTALHTPGHMAGHLSFGFGDLLFSGDHAMGWSSSLVSPPDGDLAAFLASCTRLRSLTFARYLPGHGAPLEDPAARLDTLVTHREARTAQIVAALAAGDSRVEQITARIYHDIPRALHPAAARNVFAHLVEMTQQNRVIADPHLSPAARFRTA